MWPEGVSAGQKRSVWSKRSLLAPDGPSGPKQSSRVEQHSPGPREPATSLHVSPRYDLMAARESVLQPRTQTSTWGLAPLGQLPF